MRKFCLGASVFVGVALLVVAAQGVPGVLIGPSYVFNPGHYAVLNRVFEQPVLLAVAGVVVLLTTLAIASGRALVRFGGLAIAAALAASAVLFGTPVSAEPGLPTGGRRTVEYVSPDGRFTASVTRWQKIQGPAWLVMVRSSDGLRSREHLVGCQDGNGGRSLERLAWTDPSTIRLYRADGVEFDVRVDAATAEPDHELYGGDVDACYQP